MHCKPIAWYLPRVFIPTGLWLFSGCSESPRIVEFLEPPPAALAVGLTAPSRSATAPFGAPDASIDSVTVVATGLGAKTAPWTATARRPWLTVLDSIGAGSGVLRWRRVANTLPPGTYVDTIVVTVPGAIGSPTSVVDSLVVIPPPAGTFAFSVSPKGRRTIAIVGSAPVADSAAVTTTGALGASTPWYAAKRRPHTHLKTADGIGNGVLRWTRSATGLSPGMYLDTLTVFAGGLVDAVIDTFVVEPASIPPSIQLVPSSHRDSVGPGFAGPRDDSVAIVLGGSDRNLEWTATSRLASTAFTNRTGRGGQYLRYQRLPAGLAVGLYVDTITVALVVTPGISGRLIDTLKVGPIAEPLALRLLSGGPRSRTITIGDATTYADSIFVNLGGGGNAAAAWTASVQGRTTNLATTSGVGSGWLNWRRSGGGLPLGIHVDTVAVAAPGALGSPSRIIDTLVVIREALPLAVTLQPASRYREVELGSGVAAPDSTRVVFTGTGAAGAGWSAAASRPWTELIEFNGVGDGLLRWVRRPAGLIAGTYVDTLVLTAPGAAGSPLRLVDTLVVKKGVVTPPPTPGPLKIAVTPSSRKDSVAQGATGSISASATLAFTGTGADTIHWTATSGRPWTTVNTPAGISSGPVQWARSPAGLAAGIYVDTVRIGVPGASGLSSLIVDSLVIAALPDTTTPIAGEANSPTGRNPRLIWTKKRQFVWNRMRADNLPWYRLLKDNADRTGTGAERYGDDGAWAATMFQVTGEATYARKALGKVRQTLATTFSANFIRDLFAESVWIYDWIYPALTPAERDELIAGFNRMATYAVGDDPTHRGMRTEDSDETTGYYFGLVFVDLATGPENPLAGRWTTGEIHNPFRLPVGGLDVTGPGRTTARNAIADFIRISAGGDWLESAQYNPETLAYLWMGIEGVKTATGVDHFPEATALSRQVAAAMAAQVTSDLTQRIQWGDDEHPRDFRSRMFRFTTQLGMVAGLNQDNPEGQAAQGLLLDLAAKYGWTGYLSAEPWSRLFPFYNPYAARGTWAARPSAHYASGMGHLAVRQGASLFSAFAGTRTGADHGIEYMGDFQLYRNGEWAVTHPLGYGTAALAVGTVNSVALAGLNAMATRGPVVEQHGADWWALSMSTSGSYYWPGYYDPPPAFVTQWQRGLVYFQEGGADVIVIRDSLVTANPMALPKLARYYPTDQAKITAANGLAEWQIHALTRPTITGSRVEWTTPGGQPVRVYTLAPGDAVQTIIDEKTQWPTVPIIEITDPERHFQVKLRAPSHRPIEQFLNVVVVGDPSLAPVAVPGGVKVGSTTVQFTPTGVIVTR